MKAENNITIEQLCMMKHAIGYNDAANKGRITGIKNRLYESCRNYYTACSAEPKLDELVELKLMTSRPFPQGGEGQVVYHVTKEGFEFLGKILNTKITEMR